MLLTNGHKITNNFVSFNFYLHYFPLIYAFMYLYIYLIHFTSGSQPSCPQRCGCCLQEYAERETQPSKAAGAAEVGQACLG